MAMTLNSTLTHREDLTPDLAIFRVKPDGELFDFEAGQYTVLGLPGSAPRCPNCDPDDEVPEPPDKLIIRAYSIASSSRQKECIEFYVALIRSGKLTPRLWTLNVGDRLWLGPKAKGLFTLDSVEPDKGLLMIATGTGLAPYMSMIGTHHRCNIGRKFVVVHGARYSWDLGYRNELEALHHGCRTFGYLPTITRVERDTGWGGHVGRIQSVFEDGSLERAAGETISPERMHALICGNPEMVESVQEILEARGFTAGTRDAPGTLHIERYW